MHLYKYNICIYLIIIMNPNIFQSSNKLMIEFTCIFSFISNGYKPL